MTAAIPQQRTGYRTVQVIQGGRVIRQFLHQMAVHTPFVVAALTQSYAAEIAAGVVRVEEMPGDECPDGPCSIHTAKLPKDADLADDDLLRHYGIGSV